jgi:hypothetical protein
MSKSFFFSIMRLDIYHKLHNHFAKGKAEQEAGSRSGRGSASGSSYFLLEAEAPEAFALRVEAKVLKILALPHHWP